MLKPLNYNSGWLSEFMDPQSNLGLWLTPPLMYISASYPLFELAVSTQTFSPGVQDVFDSVLASLTKESMLIFCTQWLFPFEGNGGSVLW